MDASQNRSIRSVQKKGRFNIEINRHVPLEGSFGDLDPLAVQKPKTKRSIKVETVLAKPQPPASHDPLAFFQFNSPQKIENVNHNQDLFQPIPQNNSSSCISNANNILPQNRSGRFTISKISKSMMPETIDFVQDYLKKTPKSCSHNGLISPSDFDITVFSNSVPQNSNDDSSLLVFSNTHHPQEVHDLIDF